MTNCVLRQKKQFKSDFTSWIARIKIKILEWKNLFKHGYLTETSSLDHNGTARMQVGACQLWVTVQE